MDRKLIKVALVGSPNSGKTTIFNNITGARQHVGNYPGVTVEHKMGERVFQVILSVSSIFQGHTALQHILKKRWLPEILF